MGYSFALEFLLSGLEFSKLKDANEYLRTVTLDSTSQLTVNGLDIPLAVSDALIKDELGAITDITAVRMGNHESFAEVGRRLEAGPVRFCAKAKNIFHNSHQTLFAREKENRLWLRLLK
jgi:hypothetical protein